MATLRKHGKMLVKLQSKTNQEINDLRAEYAARRNPIEGFRVNQVALMSDGTMVKKESYWLYDAYLEKMRNFTSGWKLITRKKEKIMPDEFIKRFPNYIILLREE